MENYQGFSLATHKECQLLCLLGFSKETQPTGYRQMYYGNWFLWLWRLKSLTLTNWEYREPDLGGRFYSIGRPIINVYAMVV